MKVSCDGCRKSSLELYKKEPDCDTCRPNILENNMEAWTAYKMLTADTMGLTIHGLKIICDELKVKDFIEVILKVQVLMGAINKENGG